MLMYFSIDSSQRKMTPRSRTLEAELMTSFPTCSVRSMFYIFSKLTSEIGTEPVQSRTIDAEMMSHHAQQRIMINRMVSKAELKLISTRVRMMKAYTAMTAISAETYSQVVKHSIKV